MNISALTDTKVNFWLFPLNMQLILPDFLATAVIHSANLGVTLDASFSCMAYAVLQQILSPWLLGSYSELNPFLPLSLLCCSVVPSLYPRGTLGSLFTLFLHFCRLVYTESSRSPLKMCQSTPSCGKMLLIVFFLTRLNLKCYPMESLCTPSSPSLQSAAHSTPPIHSFLSSVPLLISRSTFLDFQVALSLTSLSFLLQFSFLDKLFLWLLVFFILQVI